MSTVILASSNDVLPVQLPNARPLEAEANNCGVPITPAQFKMADRASLESADTAALLQPEGFIEEACPAENILRPTGILVIEDDWLLRESLGQGLRNRGLELWSAENGSEGVEVYHQFWPLIDVVLSDVQMPVLDGPGTLDALRKINPSVCFCFMTGDTRASTRARLLECGALRVFEKPLPSVASVAQELWDLAASPYHVIGFPEDTNAEEPQPDPSVGEIRVRETPKEYRVFAWICAPLLTSISRISSLLGHRDFWFAADLISRISSWFR